jgi:hypothetical protein
LQAYAVAARKQAERPSIVHTSLYLPEPVYESLRKIAFEERLKIHDIVLEGIDAALRRRVIRRSKLLSRQKAAVEPIKRAWMARSVAGVYSCA